MMPTPKSEQPIVRFTLDPHSPSKRPEQLAALIESAVQREFPDVADVVQVSHSRDDAVISLLNLDKLEEDTAKKIAHRARVVFNDFMINPWY